MPRPRFCRFLRDQRGAVAATYAIALPALIMVAGVAFDYGRMVAMDSELQNAADHAALAAVTQLDGEDGARDRAATAAQAWITNSSLMTQDDRAVTVTATNVVFWQDKEKEEPADSDANARYVEVTVDPRKVTYVLTPVMGALGPILDARAMAGLASSVCKVPPIMICNPDPTVLFDADSRIGQGFVATGKGTGHNGSQAGQPGNSENTSWSPGNFGFLQVDDADATNRNAALLKALAYANPPIDCIEVDENEVSTGNPQNVYDAINTRFDIYDFPSNGNGNVLASCQSGVCPPAPNSMKDFTNSNPNGNNGCRINNSNGNGNPPGWRLPPSGQEFRPVNPGGAYNATTKYNPNGPLAVMGLPRDLCHYTTYGTGLCPGTTGRFGDGKWARQDYFTKYHNLDRPSNWQTITRYETYLWELDGHMPTGGAPVCAAAGDSNRRVLTVAVVDNCASLNGTSKTVDIGEFVDVFLVEPIIDDSRRHSAFTNALYMEVIGKSRVAGDGTYGSQEVRRDVPYLIQ